VEDSIIRVHRATGPGHTEDCHVAQAYVAEDESGIASRFRTSRANHHASKVDLERIDSDKWCSTDSSSSKTDRLLWRIA